MRLAATKWSQSSIKDVCELIVDCVNKTAPVVPESTPYKMVRTTNVRNGWVNLSEVKYVTEDTFKKWTRRSIPQMGDVILTREAPLGEVGMLRSNETVFLGQRLMMYRADPEKLDNRFLLYAFQEDFLQGQIKAFGSGATVEHMRVPDCEKLVINLPPLSTQREIASVLSVYDDLIENNTRRIQILEEMAQAIYREWFVNFRFPGHEKVRMVDSPLGKIPEGWDVARTGDQFTVVLGGTPSRQKTEFWEYGTIPWINSGKVNDLRVMNESELITKLGLDKSSAKLMPERTTVVAITGATLGQVSLLEIEACANQSVVGIYDEQRVWSEYLYLTFEEVINEVIQHASGGAQQHINKEIVKDVKIALPPRAVLDMFSSLAQPIFDMTANLLVKNDNLRHTRDMLLPKLISGEITLDKAGTHLESLS